MKHYVYKLTNKINHIVYVGKSYDPVKRWGRHRYDAKRGSTALFHNAIRELGEDTFELTLLEEHPDARSAYKAENHIVTELRAIGVPLYNGNNGGLGAPNPTPEVRAKISAAVKQALKFADLSFYKDPLYIERLTIAVTASYTFELRSKRKIDAEVQWERWRQQQAEISPQRGHDVYKDAGDRCRRRGDLDGMNRCYEKAKEFSIKMNKVFVPTRINKKIK